MAERFRAVAGTRARVAVWVVVCALASCTEREAKTAPPEPSSERVAVSRAALNASVTVNVLGDTYIRSGSPNQNAGGDTVVRLQQSGKNRGLLFFDTNAIRQAVTPGSLVTATLELTIDSNGNNWGTTGRTIALHRLKKASAEYSATWNCAIDSSVANSTADCSGATAWNMDSTDPNVQPWLSPEIGTSNITNNQTGVVTFNVTAEIAAMLDNSWAGYGFLLKKVDESAAGSIDFKSKERGVPPRLVLEVQPPAAGSGGGGQMDAGVQRATITASADNHVRQGEPNQNFGSSGMLRIQASGRNRAIFNFNPTEIHAALGTNGLVRATLELTITQTFNNWGPDRALGAHRMRGAWTELGSTWNCGVDSNTGNSSADCGGSNAWYMWRPDLPDEQEAWVNPPESTALVQSGQTGIVSFDVTQSIACYLAGHTPLNGVMVKKEMENQAGHVEFASRETMNPPVLVLEYNSSSGFPVTYTQCTGLLPDGGVADGGVDAGTCTPSATTDVTCDNIDDDCDGQKDEDYSVTNTTCGQGACAATGEQECVNGAVQDTCTAGSANGTDNDCDGIDQDCDGLIDEAYVSTQTTCGVGACLRSGTSACVAGAVQNGCTPGMPAADDSTCNAVDDNCNGSVDEGYASVATACGVGACMRSGSTSCITGTVQDDCSAGVPAASDETCDGVDDNCNGLADEDYVSVVTSCGVGACAGAGITSCSAGSVHDSCVTGMPEADDSCDLVDQDCDGKIDEGCESDCSDTLDNDDDGHTDCADGDCHDAAECTIGRTCTADTECTAMTVIGTPGKCLSLFPGGYCTRDCVPEADPDTCPAGSFCSVATGTCVLHCDAHDACPDQRLECSDLDSLGDTALLCRPTCSTGTCRTGTYCSQPDNLCLACTTTDTSCDRVDQDCDGTPDDDVPHQPTSCGQGACTRNGTRTCVNGQMQDDCVAGTPATSDATCDGIDDNCNGAADEGYVPLATSCGIGACVATGTTSCVAGAVHDSCTAGTPAADDATCNGIDDDCDQRVDEDYAPTSTNCGVGACASTGSSSCVGGAVQSNCVPGTPGSDTTCNGVDEDCDGHIDEQYVPQSTTCGVGACAASGTTSCASGEVQSTCTPGAPSPDTDCDGIDDDCDGHVDESNVLGVDDGNACTTDACDPVTGTVTHTNLAVGASCSDGNPCNGDETCQGGSSDPLCANVAGPFVAWWPGENSTTDVVGSHNGIAVGGLTYAPAFVGLGFNFDGVDDYVDVSAHAAALNLSGGVTLEMWVRVPEDTCRTIFHLRQDATHEALLQVGANCTSLLAGELVTWQYINGANTTAQVFQATTAQRPILIGTNLRHLALTFDGVGTTRIYIDGVSRTVVSSGSDRGKWGLPSATTALIGARQSGPAGSSFLGVIDEMTLYNRVLSASEISSISGARQHGKCAAPTPSCFHPIGAVGNDGNPCTIDSCDPVTGITHTPAPVGTVCTDANACTQGDACDASATCVGTPVNIDDANACTTDACNTATGVVTHQAVATDDGNACTVDSCDPSLGLSHTPVLTDDSNPCTIDSCDPATGVVHTAAPAGTSCSDGVFCNGTEACSLCTPSDPDFRGWWAGEGNAANALGTGVGTTTGNVIYGAGQAGQAFVFHQPGASVNLGNDPSLQFGTNGTNAKSFTVAFWVQFNSLGAGQGIVDKFLPTANGVGDGWKVEHYIEGFAHGMRFCAGTTQGVNGCTLATQVTTGQWYHFAYVRTWVPSAPNTSLVRIYRNGQSIDFINMTTFTETNSASLRIGTNAAGVGFDGSLDELVVYARALTDAEVVNVMNGTRPCSGALGCAKTAEPAIDDGNQCTTDGCDGATDTPTHVIAVGTACDDANACTGSGTCSASGVCQPGAAVPIPSDGNACTDDVCDPVQGVKHPFSASGAPCEDGQICTGPDTCNGAGACLSGPPLTPGHPFTTDTSCDRIDQDCDGVFDEDYPSSCVSEQVAFCYAGAVYTHSCSDGNACNGLETCVGSACTAGPPVAVPDDHNDCTVDSCDPVLGEQHTPVAENATCATDASCNGHGTCRCSSSGDNLLRNSGFEAITRKPNGYATPLEWLTLSSTTFMCSQDTSYGCTESMSAPEGGSYLLTNAYLGNDRTTQILTTPLTPGARYDLHAMMRGGLYRVYLSSPLNDLLLGTLDATSNTSAWVDKTLSFAAPADASSRFLIGFESPTGGIISRIDAITLTASLSCNAGSQGNTCAPEIGTDDGNGCTADVCNGDGTVSHVPSGAGASCDDGNSCTKDDACTTNGGCRGTPDVTNFCTHVGSPCTSNADCSTFGGVCLTEAATGIPGGMCSVGCTSTCSFPGTTCVPGSNFEARRYQSFDLAGPTLGSYCFPSCQTDPDCPSSMPVCDPVFNACRAVCDANSDCNSGRYCECAHPNDTSGACTYHHFCLPAQPAETNCNDGLDEDADGYTDCRDSNCTNAVGCGEICNNNIDDDGDGLRDCKDAECSQITCESCGPIDYYASHVPYIPGVDDDHDGFADCADPDCVGLYPCVENDAETCSDGLDNDRDGLTDCQEASCGGLATCTEDATSGHCVDGIDNDADGLLDCLDPPCLAFLGCTESGDAGCSDGIDNEGDGFVDCADPSCGTAAPCVEVTDARCSDGLDNDADGQVDCADPGCTEANGVTVCTEGGTHDLNCGDHIDNDHDGFVDCFDTSCRCFERCDDGIDNDGNGATDCADLAHCLHDPACTENCTDGIDNNGVFGADCHDPNCNGDPSCIEFDCGDGLDNEADGKADCADTDCTDSPDCPEICDNGVDDDANFRVDCGDPECAVLYQCSEAAHCADGVDNDRDTRIDCDDSNCAGQPNCVEAGNCHDGVDNDRDGQLDCLDSDCAGAAPCIPEICGNMVDDDGDGMFDCADHDCAGFSGCDDPALPLSAIAPPNNPAVATTLFDSMAFVYGGPSPVQYFVGPETIVRQRAAVVRGLVTLQGGAPLPGVVVTVLDHPEFGETRTAGDGLFTLVVNGGGDLTINYALNGYIAVQRKLPVNWNQYAFVDHIVMTAYDSTVSTVDLTGAATGVQSAAGSAVTDQDGTRQAIVLFPQGVGAVMQMPDGSTQPLASLSVRATELTVGPEGPDAMPAQLPANTGYTYAVELTADEALAANATAVLFSQPVSVYVENFVGAPVGTAVPSGYYDRKRGAWVPSANGRVVKILNITGGSAVLDVTGNGSVASSSDLAALGITSAELQTLATLHQANETLWRVPVDHFTPWDFNWPYNPPPNYYPPPDNGPDSKPDPNKPDRRPDKDDGTDDDCEKKQQHKSTVGCSTRSLGEEIAIAGTSYSLAYDSLRAEGPTPLSKTITVTLTRDSLPANLLAIRLDVEIGGRRFEQVFAPSPSQTYDFAFDGLDAAGRPMYGSQTVGARLCYGYGLGQPAVAPSSIPAFAQSSGGDTGGAMLATPRSVPFFEATCKRWSEVTSLSPGTSIDGWDLDVYHHYDPLIARVYEGNGQRQSVNTTTASGTSSFAGTGEEHSNLLQCGLLETFQGPNSLCIGFPIDMKIGPDGSLYELDGRATSNYVAVRRPDGLSKHLIGRFDTTIGEDSFTLPATRFDLGAANRLAIGSDGMVYVAGVQACSDSWAVYRFSADGQTVTRVAGTDNCSAVDQDGVPAVNVPLGAPRGFALGPDGSMYIGERSRVRRVGADGFITTVAGKTLGSLASDPDTFPLDAFGKPDTNPMRATDMAFADKISDIAIAPDGALYISTAQTVFVVQGDGAIRRFAGGAGGPPSGDFFEPDFAPIRTDRLTVGFDGGVYVLAFPSNQASHVYKILNGALIELAASSSDPYQEGMSRFRALSDPTAIAVHPDGRVLIGDGGRNRVLTLGWGADLGESIKIPSSDGQELWEFDAAGRHIRTYDAINGTVLHEFVHDAADRLIGVRDRSGNLTSIVRDASGAAIRIVPPFAQPTTLIPDSSQLLGGLIGPDLAQYDFTYRPGTMLLTTMTNPNHDTSTYTYDADGKLQRDEDSIGGFLQLDRVEQPGGFDIVATKADVSNPTVYRQTHDADGSLHTEVHESDGTMSRSDSLPDGTQTQIARDGTITTVTNGPDPRWLMQAPVPKRTSVQLPSGLERVDTEARSATLGVPGNPSTLTQLTSQRAVGNDPPGTMTYDVGTRMRETLSPEGRGTVTTLDSLGRVVKSQLAGLEPVALGYDARGHLTKLAVGSGPDARVTTYGYRSDGYVGTIDGPMEAEQSVLTPDAAGRIVDMQRPDGQHVGTTYDGLGQPRYVTPPGKPAHELAYTPVGLLADYIAPPSTMTESAATTHFEYNRNRKIEFVTRPDGRNTDYQYDPQTGRLIEIASASTVVDFAYNASGQIEAISSTDARGEHMLSSAYDGAVPTRDTWTGGPGMVNGSIERVYDDHFRLDKLLLNGAVLVDYGYDYDDLLTSAGPMTIVRRADNGMVSGTTLGQTETTESNTSFGELGALTATYAADILYGESVTNRDQMGRIVGLTEIANEAGTLRTRNKEYHYDRVGRLIDVFLEHDEVAHYDYDPNGNRTSYVGAVTPVLGRYDNQDRLSRYCPEDAQGNAQPISGLPCFTYTYRATGELLTRTDALLDQTTQFAYDEFGTLRGARLGDGRQIEYEIDPARRRVGKYIDGVKQWGLLYQSGLQPIAQLDAANDVLSVFVYGTHTNVPDYMTRQGTTYRLVTDHLGSVQMVVDVETGQVAQQLEYDEFGNVLLDTNPGFQPFGFAGGIYDADTGLVRFGARDYDAVTGRWTAKDPILFAGGTPNFYQYVNDDPINRLDPMGLESDDEGPYHPPEGVKLHCTWLDNCSVLSLKLNYLDHTIESHKNWDRDHKVCRHADEISDLERARAQCAEIHNYKCTGKPEWVPEPDTVPAPDPKKILPFIIVVCIACPECCAIPVIAL